MSALWAWRFIRCRPWPAERRPLPTFQAHRGDWTGGAGQNTLEAFRSARSKGYRMAELDVRLSKDAVPVVFHDPTLEKFGDRRRVLDLTAGELRHLTGAPTLEQVLKDVAGTEEYNVELKSDPDNLGALEYQVSEVVNRAGAVSRILFSSFRPWSLALMAKLQPEIPRALLASQQNEDDNWIALRKMWFAPVLPIHMLNLDDRDLDAEALSVLRDLGLPFAVWTVNDPGRAEELLREGAISIITDEVTG